MLHVAFKIKFVSGQNVLLRKFGRYFVNSYEVKVFSSILGIFEGIIYLAMAAILYNDARTLTE